MSSKAKKFPDLWVDPEDDPRETGSSAGVSGASWSTTSGTSGSRSR